MYAMYSSQLQTKYNYNNYNYNNYNYNNYNNYKLYVEMYSSHYAFSNRQRLLSCLFLVQFHFCNLF